MEDKRIIELFFERSEEAIAESERKYGKYLRYIAFSILGNDSDCEEIENDTYLRYQYDDPHMDAWLDKQIEVKNLFVLRMPMRDLGGDLKLVEVDTTGTGEGYYFCGGKYVPITWQKDAYNAPITFYDANGSELSVARGQTFISVVTETASVDIE